MKTELTLANDSIVTSFRFDERFEINVPVEMIDRYRYQNYTVNGTATFGRLPPVQRQHRRKRRGRRIRKATPPRIRRPRDASGCTSGPRGSARGRRCDGHRTGPARQQPQPPPTFRAETNIIEVDTVVTDAMGNAVRGLTKEDFTILDDGRPQPVSNMSFVDVSVDGARSCGRPRSAPVDVSSNDVPFNGRVYVLILDDVQVDQEYGRDVIGRRRFFIERYFQERDLMAVVFTSRRKDVGQDFTNNRELLWRR